MRDMISSVLRQQYKEWELCLADASDNDHNEVGKIVKEYALTDERIKYEKLSYNGGISENTNACIDLSTGNYLALLDHDDVLDPKALQSAARMITKTGADFVYTDEAKFNTDPEEWFSPNYKPDFSKYELRAHNYICHLTIYSRALLDVVGRYRKECDGSQDHDMVLRLTEKANRIVHIPRVLYYWRVHENSVSSGVEHKEYAIRAAEKAVLDQVRRSGRDASIVTHPPFPLIYDVRYDGIPERTAIDIIVYQTANISNLKECMTSLQANDHDVRMNFYLLSDSERVGEYSEADEYLRDGNTCRIVKISGGMAETINQLTCKTSGEYILFINGNSVIRTEGFVKELLNLAQLDDVAAVGPKITTDDRVIFSAGIATCAAVPNGIVHRFQGEVAESYGYEAGLCHVREASAVSANCFMAARDKFQALGGFSEKFRDYVAIDFCLRARDNNEKILWTPYAEMTVHNPIDRKLKDDEVVLFRSDWKRALLVEDPYYNKSIRYDVDHITDRNTPVLLIRKGIDTLKENGVSGLKEKIRVYYGGSGKRSSTHMNYTRETSRRIRCYKDVLFVNGCAPQVPHPTRYRVLHQQEQLNACGLTSDVVYYDDVNADLARFYRLFIIFRCPYTDQVGKLIESAKSMNRTVLYDVDDLVIDTKYTDTIPYVQQLKGREREVYDDGVIRMGKTLKLCDGAITTTEALAEELRHYVPEVFINRNTASDAMYQYSEQAIYKRDILPTAESKFLPEWLTKKEYEAAMRRAEVRRNGHVRIGYFSGSITHNKDFEMILPAISKILKENSDVELHIVGLLDLPDELKPFSHQIVAEPFTDWKKLPDLIASVDINIAPITKSIFNAAKSENKWTEASLVKVPTIASNFGAFKSAIQSGETGLLCSATEDWYCALNLLVHSADERHRIGENAYKYVKENYITIYTGGRLAGYIKDKMRPNIAFALPSLNISGGNYVVLKHAVVLKKAGKDVFIVNMGYEDGWLNFEDERLPVLSKTNAVLSGKVDCAVATFWETLFYFENYRNIVDVRYLVQNYETDFYLAGDPIRIRAEQSYSPCQPVQFMTISKWCAGWLKERYRRDAVYIPNGVDCKQFYPKKRVMSGKIRILIEGDSESYYKNVDESFRIVQKLDPGKYEIWYLSYNGRAKEWYRADRMYYKLPHEKVDEVYRNCDILLKSSILESFSYPPLEMMATGGYVVAVPNGGNREYLEDGVNCLFYTQGDLDDALHQISRIVADSQLREHLYLNGQNTVQNRDWKKFERAICENYG